MLSSAFLRILLMGRACICCQKSSSARQIKLHSLCKTAPFTCFDDLRYHHYCIVLFCSWKSFVIAMGWLWIRDSIPDSIPLLFWHDLVWDSDIDVMLVVQCLVTSVMAELPLFNSSAEERSHDSLSCRIQRRSAVLQALVFLIVLFKQVKGQTTTETIAAFRSQPGKNSIPSSGLPAAHGDVSPPSPGVWCHFPSIDRSVAGRMSSSCSLSLELCCLSLCLSSIKSMRYLSEVFTSV